MHRALAATDGPREEHQTVQGHMLCVRIEHGNFREARKAIKAICAARRRKNCTNLQVDPHGKVAEAGDDGVAEGGLLSDLAHLLSLE